MATLEQQITKLRGDLRARIERERKEQRAQIKEWRRETEREVAELKASVGESHKSTVDGVRFVAGFEGFPPGQPYNDPVGHCTVGYGHLLHRGVCSTADRQRWSKITRDDALELLKRDMAVFAAAVDRLVTTPLNAAQFDALVSFAFNLGVGALEQSTLLKLLNKGDYKSVPSQLARWVFADGVKLEGLARRRAAEGKLFSTGRYS